MITILYLCLAIPLAAAVLLMLFRQNLSGDRTARWVALGAGLCALFASVVLLHNFRQLPAGIPESPVQARVEQRIPWLTLQTETGAEPVRLEFQFGLDGVSVTMILLTTLLTVSAILISWESIRDRESEFYTSLLVLEAGLIGVFCSFDIVMFYVFFELTLIPLFFLIAIWGGPQKRYAAIKFFLYTLAGSLVTLLGLVGLVTQASSSGLATPCSIPDLSAWLRLHPLSDAQQIALFCALSAGFLIKVPVFPFHTWLPLAHVEAPTAGSVLLAGVLLKLGSFGFLRLCLPMFPHASLVVGLPVIGALSVVGIIYGSLCALAQRDIKKLVAYSSVAHLGFCMLGLFALNAEGLTGGILQMINHGLSTGALFLLVGMVYDRYHTRQMDDLGGLATRLPLIACSMVFVSMASIGLPGLNGFVGEMLSLAGMFKAHVLYAVLGATGVVLGAWYLLTMVQYAFFGKLKEPAHGEHHITDMNLREFASLAPLAVLCLVLGVGPQPLIDLIKPDVLGVARLYEPPPAIARVAQLNHSADAETPDAR